MQAVAMVICGVECWMSDIEFRFLFQNCYLLPCARYHSLTARFTLTFHSFKIAITLRGCPSSPTHVQNRPQYIKTGKYPMKNTWLFQSKLIISSLDTCKTFRTIHTVKRLQIMITVDTIKSLLRSKWNGREKLGEVSRKSIVIFGQSSISKNARAVLLLPVRTCNRNKIVPTLSACFVQYFGWFRYKRSALENSDNRNGGSVTRIIRENTRLIHKVARTISCSSENGGSVFMTRTPIPMSLIYAPDDSSSLIGKGIPSP
ncbi:unnamed protein product [Albugo candida]|uniref:Uncharacterized protein n=1 Tax=Albugo candida TaxID=65357 RepID=A0A024FYE7_9STRA|nr:unnamed protein product [Albugo candida]|eukprot:CCI39614.1 unnamed protein product [Albugo candida]